MVIGQKINKWTFEDQERSVVLYFGKSCRKDKSITYFCQDDWGVDIPWYFSPLRDNW